MALDTVIRGVAVQTDAQFYSGGAGSSPFVATAAAQWSVFDHTGELVLSGSAVQDPGNLQRWVATFTIPTTAPVSDLGKKYRIEWAIANAQTSKTATEYFAVSAEGAPPAVDTTTVLMAGAAFRDSIVLDAQPDHLTVALMKDDRTVLWSSGELVGVVTPRQGPNGTFIYDVSSPSNLEEMTVTGNAGLPYISEWVITPASRPQQTEIHFIFVITANVMQLMNQVRSILDKARNLDINPSLQFTETDLVTYLVQGVDRFNAVPPYFTSFSIHNVPLQIRSLIVKCAQYEAALAQYMAEGQAAFEFSGQTTQLTVNRTEYWQTLMQELNQHLQEQIPRAKDLMVKSSSAGVLSVSMGPSTNFGGTFNNTALLARLRGGFTF